MAYHGQEIREVGQIPTAGRKVSQEPVILSRETKYPAPPRRAQGGIELACGRGPRMKKSRRSPKLKFQPGTHFTCTSCGKCCRSSFQIPVEESTAKKIRASSTYRTMVKAGYYPLQVVEGGTLLNYDESGACYFHQNDLCRLHSEHGLLHKPTICQMYPFNAVPTSDGIYVSLLYSCPAVVAEEGPPVESHAEELRGLFRSPMENLPMLPPVRRHILVTSRSTVTWSQYLELEARFSRSFEASDPVRFLFYSACRLVRPDPEKAEFQAAQHDRNDFFEELFEPFVWQIATYLEEIAGHADLDAFFESFQRGAPTFSQRLDSELPSFEILTPFKKSDRRAVARYVSNLVHGKRLVIGPSLVCRLLLLAAALAILLFELRFRRRRGEPDALECAFEVCEERIVSQCNDLEPLLLEVEEILLSES